MGWLQAVAVVQTPKQRQGECTELGAQRASDSNPKEEKRGAELAQVLSTTCAVSSQLCMRLTSEWTGDGEREGRSSTEQETSAVVVLHPVLSTCILEKEPTRCRKPQRTGKDGLKRKRGDTPGRPGLRLHTSTVGGHAFTS